MKKKASIVIFLVLSVVGAMLFAQTPKPPAAPPADDPADSGWPREFPAGDVVLRVYQPQLESWDGFSLKARAAVGVVPAGAKDPHDYGVVWISSRTEVDKVNRQVTFIDLTMTKADFPTLVEKGPVYRDVVAKGLTAKNPVISLDRMEAALAAAENPPDIKTYPVSNEPPKIFYSTTPALLVLVDGEPVLRPMTGTTFQRVINTRVLLVFEPKAGRYFLRIMAGWMTAPALDQTWTVATKPPAELAKALSAATAAGQVDLLEGQPLPDDNTQRMTLSLAAKSGKVPAILISQVPAELIQVEGSPQTEAIPDTPLLWVTNTANNLFLDPQSALYYVLFSGRWFRSPNLTGPWVYLPGDQLPVGFVKIPADHPKAAVLASIPGTAPAREAVIANAIPQTATINRAVAKLDVKYDGKPKFKDIDGTSLKYAANARTPVIRVAEDSYFAVENAVWFTGPSPNGPWAVATSVPEAIYTIPANCPVHYVVYVRIYGYTDTVVYVGYTPGYYGTVVTPEKVVVYGSGWYYPPYVGAWWYGWPCTYGYGATFVWSAAGGWAVGFGIGFGWGWYYPYWGPWGWWGPGWHPAWGWGAWGGFASVNVYGRWGETAFHGTRSAWANPYTGNIGSSSHFNAYNPHTGAVARGGRVTDANVYTGNYVNARGGAAYNPETGRVIAGGKISGGNIYNGSHGSAGGLVVYDKDDHTGMAVGKNDVYASKDGEVYRYDRDTHSWSKRDDGGWQPVDPPDKPTNRNAADTSSRENLGNRGADARRDTQPAATYREDRSNVSRPDERSTTAQPDNRAADMRRDTPSRVEPDAGRQMPNTARQNREGDTAQRLQRDYEARSRGEFRSREYNFGGGGRRSWGGGGGFRRR